MSQLGNIQTTYGKTFAIAIANTYASNISYNSNLPKNTIIISAPMDTTTYEDIVGTALLITDNNGEPILLTKTIKTGNGIEYRNDSIGLSIDNNTIKTNSAGQLYVDIASIIDNSTEIKVNSKGALEIDENFVQRASANKFGVAKVDGSTITVDNGTLHINTDKLDVAEKEMYGVVKGDNTTIKTINGIPNIIQSGLDKCTDITYGTLKPDNLTITSSNGVLSVSEQSLVSNGDIGLVKVDGTTIVSHNGTLSVNMSGLQMASPTTYGMVMFDDKYFTIEEDGTLHASSISNLNDSINSLQERIENASAQLDQIETEISQL